MTLSWQLVFSTGFEGAETGWDLSPKNMKADDFSNQEKLTLQF